MVKNEGKSILVKIKVREGRVRVKKSGNDLIIVFNGFQPSRRKNNCKYLLWYVIIATSNFVSH